jgi:tellurite resistance protein TehA-like permease
VDQDGFLLVFLTVSGALLVGLCVATLKFDFISLMLLGVGWLMYPMILLLPPKAELRFPIPDLLLPRNF